VRIGFIECSRKRSNTLHRKSEPANLCKEDVEVLDELDEEEEPITYCIVNAPGAAVEWLETHYEGDIVASLKLYGVGGPIAAMLSPNEPALVIFGSFLDKKIHKAAQALSDESGFPVMIRPSEDDPIAWWNRVESDGVWDKEPDTDCHRKVKDQDIGPDTSEAEDGDRNTPGDKVQEHGEGDIVPYGAGTGALPSGSSSLGKSLRLRGGALEPDYSTPWESENYIFSYHFRIFPTPVDGYDLTLQTTCRVSLSSMQFWIGS
jgi:hypothetical protein